MDQQKLRTLVFEKTGVRIDIDDPIFALVALNEAVLAEAVERHVALLDDATADLADQAEALLAAGSVCRHDAKRQRDDELRRLLLLHLRLYRCMGEICTTSRLRL